MPLNQPSGVAVDRWGNIYISDTRRRLIRKVDSTGTITTIAGPGDVLFGGDGGPAVQAGLRNPQGVALDSAGDLYIADAGNHRIRKVDSTGTITTIAGTGDNGFGGDGGRQFRRGSTTPGALRWTAAGTSTLLITVTIAFARSIRPARSRRLQEQE